MGAIIHYIPQNEIPSQILQSFLIFYKRTNLLFQP